MKALTSITFLSTIALLLAAGCGGNGGGSTVVGGPDSTVDQAMVEQVMVEMIIPVVQGFGVLGGEPVKTSRSARLSKAECTDLSEDCETGSAEFCQTGPSSGTIFFKSCTSDGIAIDGTVDLVVTSQTRATATFDLTIDSVALRGKVTLDFTESCVIETMSKLSVISPELTATMNGSLKYCVDGPLPTGTLDLSIVGDEIGDLRFQVELDGTTLCSVVVRDLSSGNILLTCQGDLVTGQSTCVARAG